MKVSDKEKFENQENIRRQMIEIKKHFKQFSKNDLCRLAAIQLIEIEDLKNALKYYYEKYKDQEIEEENKND